MAVIECEAAVSVEVMRVATPPDMVLVASGVAPSLKVTVPVGVPYPAATALVIVTDCPDSPVPGDEGGVLVVEPFATVTLALVLAVSGPPEECVAVTVGVPAVLKTKFDKVPVPEARVRFPAVPALSSEIVAAASLLVIVTLGAELAMIFQL